MRLLRTGTLTSDVSMSSVFGPDARIAERSRSRSKKTVAVAIVPISAVVSDFRRISRARSNCQELWMGWA